MRWRSGTPFGLLVVPLVCRSSATASGSRGAAEPTRRIAESELAPGVARELELRDAERLHAARAALSSPRRKSIALGRRSSRYARNSAAV